jgi:cold shock CspA family protein
MSPELGVPKLDESEPPPDLTGVSERMTGVAVRWDVLKGWGFVKPDSGGPDVFAHRNALHAGEFKSLKQGEHVEFRLAYTDGRPQAIEITGPDGAQVIGHPPPSVADPSRGGGRGRGRGRGMTFFNVQLPGQPAPGPDRGHGPDKPRHLALPFVPRQARKAPKPAARPTPPADE